MKVGDNNEDNWDLGFRRSLFHWEGDQWRELKSILENRQLHNYTDDMIVRNKDPDGMFSAKFFLEWKVSNNRAEVVGWSQEVWNNNLPSKIQVFMWLGMQQAIPTKFMLLKRGVNVDNSNGMCTWCNRHIESADHLLLH